MALDTQVNCVIIAHESRDELAKFKKRPSEEKLRCAFSTAASGEGKEASAAVDDVKVRRSPDEVRTADMESFLQQVMDDNSEQRQALHSLWLEAARGLVNEFGVCGNGSILEVMPE